MNGSNVSTDDGRCVGSSDRVYIDNGICEDHSNRTNRSNPLRACTLSVFFSCMLFIATSNFFFDSFSEWNRRLSSTLVENNVSHLVKGARYMDCGTAPLCGVLTLETGYGKGYYKRKDKRRCFPDYVFSNFASKDI